MGAYGEYTDFKFGDTWASEYGLVAVSTGGRYKTPIYGDVNANTTTAPGKRGVYKWESQVGAKTFSINIAFDHLAIEDVEKIKQWLEPTKVDKLVFDNEPYKYYYASLAQDLDFSYVPFKEEEYTVGSNTFTHAVYKGEMIITFVAIDNYGYSDYNNFEQYDLSYIYSGDAVMSFVDEDNVDKIVSADQIINNLQYYTFASGITKNADGDISVYTIANDTDDPDVEVYNFINNAKLTKDDLKGIINTLRENNTELYYVDPYQEYKIGSRDVSSEDTTDPITDAGDSLYQYGSVNFNINNFFKNFGAGSLKPWVVGSGLLNGSDFYITRNIYTSALTNPITLSNNSKIYTLNSGTAEATGTISFSKPVGNTIVITINGCKLKENNSVVTPQLISDLSQSITIDCSLIDEKIKTILGNSYTIEINGDYCETYAIKNGTKYNISKANKYNIYPKLAACKNVDYSKPFPTSSLEENSAISNTIFNQVGASAQLNDFKISWRHTYL